jgi:hypothetical protein
MVTTMRALLVAVAALVALAPVANATTPQDDRYLAGLKARNIGGDPDKLIGYGLTACENYETPALVVAQIEHLQAIGYTEIQTNAIIGTGLQAYCPDKLRNNPPQAAPPRGAPPEGSPPEGVLPQDTPPLPADPAT